MRWNDKNVSEIVRSNEKLNFYKGRCDHELIVYVNILLFLLLYLTEEKSEKKRKILRKKTKTPHPITDNG